MNSNDSDFLLYTLTAASEMSWTRFKKVYDALMLQRANLGGAQEPNAYDRWRLTRALDALGHLDIEFSGRGGRLYCAPTALVRLPIVGPPQAVMCGARGPQTLGQVEEQARFIDRIARVVVSRKDTDPDFAPQRILVEGKSVGSLRQLAHELGIAYVDPPPARGILEFVASLGEYLEKCSWTPRSELSWVRRDFDPVHIHFRQPGDFNYSLRLSRYEDPIRQTQISFLWCEGVATQVDLDWGRYAALHAARIRALLYDASTYRLGVPSSAPLPRIMARALTLCSGFVPHQIQGRDLGAKASPQQLYDVYASITPCIAGLVASKLGQSLVATPLKFQDWRAP